LELHDTSRKAYLALKYNVSGAPGAGRPGIPCPAGRNAETRAHFLNEAKK
jgi:hypothetical protein